jgi:hypothetical protein
MRRFIWNSGDAWMNRLIAPYSVDVKGLNA